MMGDWKWGVSPAFFLSLYGERFTPEQVCQGLGTLSSLGMDSFQAEIVHQDQLGPWLEGGARRVRRAARQNGLVMSQLVAHFMVDAFGSPERLDGFGERVQMEKTLKIADQLGGSNQITVPIGPFGGEAKQSNREKLVDKLTDIARLLQGAGYRMALEVQPGALARGGEAIRDLVQAVGFGTGYNFDTGHAWASGCRDVADFPAILQGMIYGTHLCDNDGVSNDSHQPGTGGIDWARLMGNLAASGYTGSCDLEIFCPGDQVQARYRQGMDFLRRARRRNHPWLPAEGEPW